MIVTIARVADAGRFLQVFENAGAERRREHGCRGARAYVDSEDPQRVWCIFDWDEHDYRGFLADPGIPAVAQQLGLLAAVEHPVPAAVLDA